MPYVIPFCHGEVSLFSHRGLDPAGIFTTDKNVGTWHTRKRAGLGVGWLCDYDMLVIYVSM